MIHEVLVQLVSYNGNSLDLVNNFATSFLHPAEMQVYKQIVDIASQHGALQEFIQKHRLRKQIQEDESTDYLQMGLYLQSFCDGMDEALKPYTSDVLLLERRVLQTPQMSLSMVLTQMSHHIELLAALTNIVMCISTRQLHGCQILQLLHSHMPSGSASVVTAIKIIFYHVQKVFYGQLTNWLLYGDLNDVHLEFFIEQSNTPDANDSKETDVSLETIGNTEISVDTRLWNYRVNSSLLPQYIMTSLANKILFIGQTIIMFKSDPKNSKVFELNSSVWGDREYEFFQKVMSNHKLNDFSIAKLESTIDEIKSFVTEHLFILAVEEADLVRQLTLIKDFYFLGRGELFLEFIRLASSLLKDHPYLNTNATRDVNIAFILAARNMFIGDEIDAFKFVLPRKSKSNAETDTSPESRQSDLSFMDLDGWSLLSLQYVVRWPLHLLFTPAVMDQYNELFRFLLKVKKTQLELHQVWAGNRHHSNKRHNDEVWKLRHKFIFLLEHLQYYLQVDVIESQSSLLHQTIRNTRDFDAIHRAHTIFQTNVLSQCFLLMNNEDNGLTHCRDIFKNENPVHEILNKVLHLCNIFCTKAMIWNEQLEMSEDDFKDLNTFDLSFGMFIETLLKLFSGLRSQPCGTHLSQLLLRLDFNRWFSMHTLTDQSDSSIQLD